MSERSCNRGLLGSSCKSRFEQLVGPSILLARDLRLPSDGEDDAEQSAILKDWSPMRSGLSLMNKLGSWEFSNSGSGVSEKSEVGSEGKPGSLSARAPPFHEKSVLGSFSSSLQGQRESESARDRTKKRKGIIL